MTVVRLAAAPALAALLLFSSPARALHSVAASPDGKTVAAGGDNRVLYVVNAETWEVVRRVWMGARVRGVSFTPDGALCVVLGGDHVARVLRPADWSTVREVKGLENLTLAAKAPVAISSGRAKGGGYRDQAVKIWALPGFELQGEVALAKGTRAAGLGITADGKTAYCRSAYIKDEAEKQADPGPEPKDYAAKVLWRARKDGRVSETSVIDLAGKRVVKTVRHFDTPSKFRLCPVPAGVLTVAYDRCLGVTNVETGQYEVLLTGAFAYGSGQAADGTIYTGSLRSFAVMAPDGKALAKQRIGSIPGWPEYFRGFAPLGADKVVGITDAWRIIVIDAKSHAVLKKVNVY